MVRLVPVSSKKMIKILKKLGFEEVHRKGSHCFFLHPITRKTTTIPYHGNEDISIGLLKDILRDIEITLDEFEKIR